MAKTQTAPAKTSTKTSSKKKADAPAPAPKGGKKGEEKAQAKEIKNSPANMARELLLKGKENKEVREALEKAFPTYGAAAIAPGVYRRELIKKGLLKV